MRKIWLTKDQLTPKPFYKRKLFILFIIILSFGFLFILYQVKILNELAIEEGTEKLKFTSHDKLSNQRERSLNLVEIQQPLQISKFILGVSIRNLGSYSQKHQGELFTCLTSKERISFSKLFDNYCDCKDGSDEPSTNACENGKFYCTKQLRHKTGRGVDIFIPTSRINDGICDCVDCSDEFKSHH
jgi:hypothetical protein